MFCRNCGKEIPENVKFCNYCGAGQSIHSSSASFQETPQPSYTQYAPQQQTAIAPKNKAILRVAGFCLLALSVVTVILCLIWKQYGFFMGGYINMGDNLLILMQGVMAVGGILMICTPNLRTALRIGGIALILISSLSVLVSLRYHHYRVFTDASARALIAEGKTVATGCFELILKQSGMVVVGIVMLCMAKKKNR